VRVSVYANAPSPVRHATMRLATYLEAEVRDVGDGQHGVRIERNSENDSRIGHQGYVIESLDDESIIIRGNDDEGAANGIYTLLRMLMIDRSKSPFARSWNVVETPRFPIRSMYVAPYRFGGSYGFAILSPDRWSIEEWIEYLDLMRLCNMTTLTLVPGGRIYHPDYSQTRREAWRYDVWREVMEYCHQIGMKFNWLTCPNIVPQQAFWENPDLRVEHQEAGGYYGCGLIWDKGKDLILEASRYTFEFFRGLDALEMIYSEAGLSFDAATSANPAGYFADATHAYRNLLKECGNAADYVFWNWVFDLWARVVIPESLLERYPKFRTMLDDLLPLLPKDIGWTDASMLSVAQMFGPEIRARGNPAMREGVLLGKKWGFEPVINCFWYMNPEYALNMLPHPYISRAIQEAHYSVEELQPDGVQGYRLAPPCRFIGDYTFFRLASDPSLTKEQLVEEMGGLLASDSDGEHKVSQAIEALESFWISHDPAEIRSAEEKFESALNPGATSSLSRVSHGTTFLHYIVKLAEPGLEERKRKNLRWEFYQRIKAMDTFQGITSDIVWQPESYAFFCWQVELMCRQYMWFKTSRPDVLDRSVYPEPSAEFRTLEWPKEMLKSDVTIDRGRNDMPGPLTYD